MTERPYEPCPKCGGKGFYKRPDLGGTGRNVECEACTQRPSVKPSGCRCGHPVLAHVVEDLPHYCVAKDCACLDYQRADSDQEVPDV